MKGARILVLQLGLESGQDQELMSMLQDQNQVALQIRTRRCERPEHWASELRAALGAERAELIVLGCGSDHRPLTSRRLQSALGGAAAAPILVVLDAVEPSQIVQLLDGGVSEFVLRPLRPASVLPRLWRLLAGGHSDTTSSAELGANLEPIGLIGQSAALRRVMDQLPGIGGCEATVLILGETGTGKEICARTIHRFSARSGQPFLAVNCGAVPMELFENELFGHEPGAFTHAVVRSRGLVREAAGGILFLDEINALALPAQAKLLRFLQEKEFRPLGSNGNCTADVRVMAASGADLEQAVAAGSFRQDLYYRLAVITLQLPPLRERLGDVALLAQHFVEKFAAEHGKPGRWLTEAALRKLESHHWPGNVRELENVIQRAVVVSGRGPMDLAEIQLLNQCQGGAPGSFREQKARIIAEFERKYLTDQLAAHDGHVSQAAQAAGKDPRTFRQLLRKYHLGRSCVLGTGLSSVVGLDRVLNPQNTFRFLSQKPRIPLPVKRLDSVDLK